jgi:hypothetical protein
MTQFNGAPGESLNGGIGSRTVSPIRKLLLAGLLFDVKD